MVMMVIVMLIAVMDLAAQRDWMVVEICMVIIDMMIVCVVLIMMMIACVILIMMMMVFVMMTMQTMYLVQLCPLMQPF